MSSIIAALDRTSSKSTPDMYIESKHYGENGTPQHGWGVEATKWTSKSEAQSLLTQLYFQLVRTQDHSDLEEKMCYLLKNLNWREHKEELTQLFKLTMHVRDIEAGKGEYSLAYMMVWAWSKHSKKLAEILVRSFVISDDGSHPMGSWKDIKFMCKYLAEKESRNYWLINYMCDYSVMVVRQEYEMLQKDPNFKPSLAGRWMAREKQKQYKWIHKKMSEIAFPDFVVEPLNGWRDGNQYRAAILKQKIRWNKMIVSLSKASDTPQIKMASKRWSNLDFNNIPSICLKKNSNAIRNKDKRGNQRSTEDDRIACANNFSLHLSKASSGDKTAKVHGKRLSVGELVKEAFNASGEKQTQLNLQWLSNKDNNSQLENACIIPCCDTSGSMECDDYLPISNAIGLSIRTSEICHPAFKNRILTFNSKPSWIDVSEYGDDFVRKVKKIRNDPNWAMNTNFEALCDKILDGLVSAEVNPSETKNIILAVYSDMQIDAAQGWGDGDQSTMLELIKRKFAEAGLRSKFRTPYVQPHILFWNLRKTSGFPATAFDENVSFLSGYSSTLLNVFETKGIDELRKMTPYKLLSDILRNPRYNIGSDFINSQ
tara:strand:+ start:7052 stop:8845 length:1794 start_codon:yes stop_codon:yes gene_type:complete